jgi:Ca-activated chloride channel family protein
MPRFEWPWVLLLLAAVPFVARRPARPSALPFNRVTPNLPRSRRQRWVALPAYLRVAALALLVIALAGPRAHGRRVRDISNTIALELALDCSGSMDARDMEYHGRAMSRIDVVREVSRAFVFGDAELAGRPDDMIGVVSFAEDAVTLCPLTLDHDKLRPVLGGLRIAQRADGTAIGDALAVAAARIGNTESISREAFHGKAVILITDGENNSGMRSPIEAARLARSWGVRVYAIGIRPGNAELVGAELEAIAKSTGGVARMAGTGDALREVYREIDRLERSGRSVPHFSGGWEWIYGLAASALVLVAVEVALAQTWLRRIP